MCFIEVSIVQEPFPQTKQQGEPQRVLHKSHLYALSPYKVRHQATKVGHCAFPCSTYGVSHITRGKKPLPMTFGHLVQVTAVRMLLSLACAVDTWM